MRSFASSREAKEFLVGRIVAEAEREDVFLSEVERKMLYFSETAWTLPDMSEVGAAFDRDYDQDEYEQKIGMLSRNFVASARRNDRGELEEWKAALRELRREDHYLLVLIECGNASPGTSDDSLTARVAIGVVVVGLALMAFYIFFVR